MKCALGTSNFLEEISSLSHSIVFLCFFALITEEGFHISPCVLDAKHCLPKFFLPICHAPLLQWDLSRTLHSPAIKGRSLILRNSRTQLQFQGQPDLSILIMKWFKCQPCPWPHTQFYQYLRLLHLWNDTPLIYTVIHHFSYFFAFLGLFFHLSEPATPLSVQFALRLPASFHLHLLHF